ncbi:MAG: amidoligase family protein [Oscillospiraceae bacterium]|nr:amidoligase family protein [Oscillospiraceae bacterium]
MEENTRICDICGREMEEGEGVWVGDQLVCEDCFEDGGTTCDHCGENIWISDAVQDDDMTLCQTCYDDYYHRCECCGRIIHDNNTYWRGDYPYCEPCYEDFDDEIEDYHYKPQPRFLGTGDRYLGVELEVDCGGKDDDNAKILKDLANADGERIYIKSDGSLDDGFEIVSHPMTLDYHMNNMDWETLLQEAVRMDYRSHQTSTCGLHIHVNRNAFVENQAEQEVVIGKILYFIEKHWNEVFCFSRRSKHNMNRWAARYGYEKTGEEILKKAKESGHGRYCAINLCNYDTIEFRLFRGTLKLNTFLATLQFVDTICDVAFSMSQTDLEALSWSEFVSHIEYPELVQYLKERNLYINEHVFAEEDV